MRGLLATLICGVALLLGAFGSQAAAASPAADAETAFTLSLLDRLGAGQGNLVLSPFSVYVALAMADAGAAGQTSAQIDHVLGAGSQAAALTDAQSLLRAVTSSAHGGSGAPTLDTANALWTQSGLSLGQPFVAALTDDFGAPPQSTDFAAAPGTALAAINAWVSARTGGLINSLLAPGSVTAQTAFVLANAIYLKALWANPFKADQTRPGLFSAPGGGVRVDYMNQSGASYEYGAGRTYQAVELPYRSSSLALLAILPRSAALPAYEHGLTVAALGAITRSLSARAVTLAMPKLELSTQLDLDDALQKLGMTDAFGGRADFSGITRQRPLNIALVEHAAKLKVDEHGTVAAGATAVLGPTAVERPPGQAVVIRFDRPYLLVLRDQLSGAIVFVAEVENPRLG
jgi:serpin B